MSRCVPSEFDLIQLSFDCSFCGVGAGEWCRIRYDRTRTALYLHYPRFCQARRVERERALTAEVLS